MNGARPVLIMAGGTGGHVFPALAVAERLRARGVPVTWMGTRQGLEAVLVPKAGIPIEWIGVAGLRGKGVRRLLALPFMLGRALWQAGAILRRLRPPVVLGWVASPADRAVWRRGRWVFRWWCTSKTPSPA